MYVHIDKLLNILMTKYKDKHIKIKKLNSSFSVPEKLTMNGIEYPYNFFLLRENVFNNLFDITQSNIMNFPKYDAYICKEGIFIIIF